MMPGCTLAFSYLLVLLQLWEAFLFLLQLLATFVRHCLYVSIFVGFFVVSDPQLFSIVQTNFGVKNPSWI